MSDAPDSCEHGNYGPCSRCEKKWSDAEAIKIVEALAVAKDFFTNEALHRDECMMCRYVASYELPIRHGSICPIDRARKWIRNREAIRHGVR